MDAWMDGFTLSKRPKSHPLHPSVSPSRTTAQTAVWVKNWFYELCEDGQNGPNFSLSRWWRDCSYHRVSYNSRQTQTGGVASPSARLLLLIFAELLTQLGGCSATTVTVESGCWVAGLLSVRSAGSAGWLPGLK